MAKKHSFVYDGVSVEFDGRQKIYVKGGPRFMCLAVAAELCARLIQGGATSYGLEGDADRGMVVQAYPINAAEIVAALDDMSRRPTPPPIRCV